MNILYAVPGDVDRILAVEEESFTCPWSRKSFREALESDRIRVFKAVDDSGAFCGFACLMVIDSEAEVLNIAVTPGRRHEGIGQMLMSAMLEEADSRSVETVYLEVRVSNEHARKLYEKNGFEMIGIRKKYYSRPDEDAVLMCRNRPAELE